MEPIIIDVEFEVISEIEVKQKETFYQRGMDLGLSNFTKLVQRNFVYLV